MATSHTTRTLAAVKSVPMPTDPRFQDLTGKRFGRWLVVCYTGKDRHGHSSWHCRCDCGNERSVSKTELASKESQSCGCLHRVRAAEAMRTHGERHNQEYSVWLAMKNRCLNPRAKAYVNYGGRGITVCQAWADSFVAFLADMGQRPSLALTIDRIDNNGNYEPGNCRWATRAEQALNTRASRRLTYQGVTLVLAEWSRRTGISSSTLHARLRRNWTVERTLTTPLMVASGR